jgi:hypothetical protein
LRPQVREDKRFFEFFEGLSVDTFAAKDHPETLRERLAGFL